MQIKLKERKWRVWTSVEVTGINTLDLLKPLEKEVTASGKKIPPYTRREIREWFEEGRKNGHETVRLVSLTLDNMLIDKICVDDVWEIAAGLGFECCTAETMLRFATTYDIPNGSRIHFLAPRHIFVVGDDTSFGVPQFWSYLGGTGGVQIASWRSRFVFAFPLNCKTVK